MHCDFVDILLFQDSRLFVGGTRPLAHLFSLHHVTNCNRDALGRKRRNDAKDKTTGPGFLPAAAAEELFAGEVSVSIVSVSMCSF